MAQPERTTSATLLARIFRDANLVVFSFAFATVLVFPSYADVMTLQEALSTAYIGNPQLEAQRAATRATDEEVAKALAGWRPSVGVDGTYGLRRDNQAGLGNQVINSTPRSAQIVLSQPIFDGQTLPDVRRAKAASEAARAQLITVEQTVLLNTAIAYCSVLRDAEIVETYRRDISQLRSFVSDVDKRLALGELTKTDAAQAAARLLGSQLNLTSAEAQLATSQAEFEHLVGRSAETLADPVLPTLPSENEAMALVHESNPGLMQSRAEAIEADFAVDKATGALLPTLSLKAQYGNNIDTVAPGIRDNGLSIVAELSIPLYQGGAEESSIRQAKEQRTQANFLIGEAERKANDDFKKNWATWLSSNTAAELATKQADRNETAFIGSIIEARVGGRTPIDILNADQELLQSRIQAISQRESKNISAYQVLSSMGKMTAASLNLPVTLYDPMEYYDSATARWFSFGE